MRQMARQPTFAATDVQNLFPRSDNLRKMLEFGPGKTGRGQYPLEIPTAMQLAVKNLIARQHWVEKGEPARRFPQPEALDAAELAIRCDPECPPPQSNDQPAADRLNMSLRREASDRTQWDGLRRH
jgi:hypothetical protein